jgi:hypothetical protein
MTLAQFWTMIFGKQIVWDERARGRDKLAQRWVQRLRFSDTHLGLANLAQLPSDKLPERFLIVPDYFTGYRIYQALTHCSPDDILRAASFLLGNHECS